VPFPSKHDICQNFVNYAIFCLFQVGQLEVSSESLDIGAAVRQFVPWAVLTEFLAMEQYYTLIRKLWAAIVKTRNEVERTEKKVRRIPKLTVRCFKLLLQSDFRVQHVYILWRLLQMGLGAFPWTLYAQALDNLKDNFQGPRSGQNAVGTKGGKMKKDIGICGKFFLSALVDSCLSSIPEVAQAGLDLLLHALQTDPQVAFLLNVEEKRKWYDVLHVFEESCAKGTPLSSQPGYNKLEVVKRWIPVLASLAISFPDFFSLFQPNLHIQPATVLRHALKQARQESKGHEETIERLNWLLDLSTKHWDQVVHMPIPTWVKPLQVQRPFLSLQLMNSFFPLGLCS
jgi:hypothetical protein